MPVLNGILWLLYIRNIKTPAAIISCCLITGELDNIMEQPEDWDMWCFMMKLKRMIVVSFPD
jgi:hypothetical protein